jgi:translation initiation factor 1
MFSPEFVNTFFRFFIFSFMVCFYVYFKSIFPEADSMDENYKLVYSDDPNKTKQQNSKKRAPGTGKALLRLEKKGRGGKSVTVIERLALSDDDLKVFCKEIKQKCGTGGTVKEHHIELQGDFRDRVRPLLEAKGYKVSG